MSLEKTLLAVAMESGEVPKPLAYAEVSFEADPVEAYQATADELSRSLGVVESLERLRKRYDVEDISQESLDIYRESVELIFLSAGLNIPVSSVVPSFEAVEKDGKVSIAGRAGKAMAVALKWIHEQVMKLRAQFKKMVAWFKAQYQRTTETLAKAKARLKALPRKLKAESARKEANEKTPDLAYTRGGLYKIFVKDGKFNSNAGHEIKEFLAGTQSAELLYGTRTTGLNVGEHVIVSDLVNKFHEFVGSNAPLIKDFTAEAHEVYEVADFLSEQEKGLFEAFQRTDEAIDDVEKYMAQYKDVNNGENLAVEGARKSIAFLNKRRQYLLEISRYMAVFSNQCSNAIIKARASGEQPAADE